MQNSSERVEETQILPQHPIVVHTVCFKAIEIIGEAQWYSAGAHRAFTREKSAIMAAKEMWSRMGAPHYGTDVKRDSSKESIDLTVYNITGGKSSTLEDEELVIWVEMLTVEKD